MFAPNRTLSGSACRAAIVSGRLAFALNLDGSGDEQAWRIDRGDELYKALRISMMIGNEAPTTSSEQIDASIGSGRWHRPRPSTRRQWAARTSGSRAVPRDGGQTRPANQDPPWW